MWCACNSIFLGFSRLFGWVPLGMVHRCLTTSICHGADVVCARCNSSHIRSLCLKGADRVTELGLERCLGSGVWG